MTSEQSNTALLQMLRAWECAVARNAEKSPIEEPLIKHLSARVEGRLARGCTAADCVLLELAEFFEMQEEKGLIGRFP
jgi:hypothetical protein